MAKMIQFVLDGCDIRFVAEAPEDITLKQLLAQCDKIKPDWCACGIRSTEHYAADPNYYTHEDTQLIIDYDSIKIVQDDVPCKIIERI